MLSSEEEDEGEEEGDSSREEVPGTSDPVQVDLREMFYPTVNKNPQIVLKP